MRSAPANLYKPALTSSLFQSKCSRTARAADPDGEETNERIHDRESHLPPTWLLPLHSGAYPSLPSLRGRPGQLAPIMSADERVNPDVLEACPAMFR